MPSICLPIVAETEPWWDWIANFPIATFIYYPIAVALKVYLYWTEHVFIGISSYCYALVDCLVNTAFHALHGTLAYAAHYTMRTGNTLDPEEYNQFFDAIWGMLTWFTYPVRKDLVVWSVEYEPMDSTGSGEVIENATSCWKLVGDCNFTYDGQMDITIGNTSDTQEWRVRLSFPAKVALLIDGYPDTRCAYYCYPFWSATFSPHLPTCWALSPEMENILKEDFKLILSYFKKLAKLFGIDLSETRGSGALISRLCCGYQDDYFSGEWDNPLYYAGIAAKPVQLCSHFLSTAIEDAVNMVLDAKVITGETIMDILNWFLTGIANV